MSQGIHPPTPPHLLDEPTFLLLASDTGVGQLLRAFAAANQRSQPERARQARRTAAEITDYRRALKEQSR